MDAVRENPLPADRDQWRIETDKIQPKPWTARDDTILQAPAPDYCRAWIDLTSKVQIAEVYCSQFHE
jgi:hypothetical protein